MQRGRSWEKQNQGIYRPEDELQIISLNNDLEQKFSPEKRKQNPWIIEPWQNQQENPSESPERRVYVPRHVSSSAKNSTKQSNTSFIRLKQVSKPLEPQANSAFSIRARCQTRPNPLHINLVQSENIPVPKRERQPSSRNSFRWPIPQITQEKVYEETVRKYKTPVSMIVYPVVNQGKRKRLFRKIDKFQSFLSTSLRK